MSRASRPLGSSAPPLMRGGVSARNTRHGGAVCVGLALLFAVARFARDFRPAAHTVCVGLVLLAVASLIFVGLAGAADPTPAPAVAVLFDADRGLTVTEAAGKLQLGAKTHGLVVWEGLEREGWAFLSPGQKWVMPRGDVPEPPEAAGGASRGARASTSMGVSLFTVQLDQVSGDNPDAPPVFLTPSPGGVVLRPAITLRRPPAKGKDRLSAGVAELSQGKTVLLRIPFKEGQTKMAWSEITDMPKELRDGLKPGDYTLHLKGKFLTGESQFTVAPLAERMTVLARVNELAGLVGNRSDPLYVQAAVEHLLDYRNGQGKPRATWPMPWTSWRRSHRLDGRPT